MNASAIIAAGMLIGLSAPFAGPAQAQQSIAPSLQYGGSGCPQADSSGLRWHLYDLNHDGRPDQLGVTYSNYQASQSAGTPVADRRRNCNMTLNLNPHPGWQYSISKVEYWNYASLPQGIIGQQQSEYEFIFYSNTATLQSVLYGPLWGWIRRQDELGPNQLVWSPCGSDVPVNIRTQIVLSGPQSLTASLRAVRHLYTLRWRQC